MVTLDLLPSLPLLLPLVVLFTAVVVVPIPVVAQQQPLQRRPAVSPTPRPGGGGGYYYGVASSSADVDDNAVGNRDTPGTTTATATSTSMMSSSSGGGGGDGGDGDGGAGGGDGGAGGGDFSLAPAAVVVCQQTVFSGLAVDCNLNSGGSYESCCARLAVAEEGSCFCDVGIVDTVRAVIGEEGLDFFRAFAERQCGAGLTEDIEACRAKKKKKKKKGGSANGSGSWSGSAVEQGASGGGGSSGGGSSGGSDGGVREEVMIQQQHHQQQQPQPAPQLQQQQQQPLQQQQLQLQQPAVQQPQLQPQPAVQQPLAPPQASQQQPSVESGDNDDTGESDEEEEGNREDYDAYDGGGGGGGGTTDVVPPVNQQQQGPPPAPGTSSETQQAAPAPPTIPPFPSSSFSPPPPIPLSPAPPSIPFSPPPLPLSPPPGGYVIGQPDPAPQLTIPPPAPQVIGSPPSPTQPDPVRRKIPGLPTIAEMLSGRKVNGEVGFFADALIATGLLQLFNAPGPYTVFAPTNRAWYQALVSLGATKEDVFEDPALTEVIMYHVARREVYTHGMFFGQKIPTMHTAAPNVARAARAALDQGYDPSQVYLALTAGLEIEVFQTILRKAYFVNGCDVRRTNVQASNGVIHVVDCVMFPPSPQPLPTQRTVAQVIVDRFELSIFEQALTGAGLLAAVNQASPENPLTVFAPTNTAFIHYIATNPGFFIDTPQVWGGE